MKQLLVAFIALAVTLGVACKKESISSPKNEIKKELSHKSLAVENTGGGGIGGYPGGADTYPHNTGLCYCGAYSVCHPVAQRPHSSSCKIQTSDGWMCPGGNYCNPPY